MSVYLRTSRRRVAAAALVAAVAAGPATARPLRVVTTIPDLASIAAAIGGDAVAVRSLSQGHEDPHFLQARPAHIVQARDADLWIRAGMDLEIGWESILLESARNRNILRGRPGFLDAADHVRVVLEVPDGPISRAMGDVHPSGNPHYLLDPLNVRSVAQGIAARMIELRPDSSDVFRAGLEAFLREIDERMFGAAALEKADGDPLWTAFTEGRIDAWYEEQGVAPGGWVARTAPLRGKPMVTFHKSFIYFAHRFGIEIPIKLEPVPGVPPSPAHLARVMERMRSDSIELVLMEPFYPRRPADFVAERTGARVAVVSTYAPDTQPDAVFRMLDAVVKAVAGD